MAFLKQTPTLESMDSRLDRECVLSNSSAGQFKFPVGFPHPLTRVQTELKKTKSLGLHLQMYLWIRDKYAGGSQIYFLKKEPINLGSGISWKFTVLKYENQYSEVSVLWYCKILDYFLHYQEKSLWDLGNILYTKLAGFTQVCMFSCTNVLW